MTTELDSQTTVAGTSRSFNAAGDPPAADGMRDASEHAWPRLYTPLSLQGQPVLLVSDGSAEAAAATRFALELTDECGALIDVVSVPGDTRIPVPPPVGSILGLNAGSHVGPAAQREEEETRRTILNVLGHPVEWPVHFALGAPVDAIARQAAHTGAALVVLGLRPPGRLERALHLEITLQVARMAGCPVLGVSRESTRLPRRALVAVDFSRASLEAARAARSLLAPNGRLILTYLKPSTYYGPNEGETLIHELGIDACFGHLVAELTEGGATVDGVVLRRDGAESTASGLLAYADYVDADLMAMGSSRYGRIEHMLLGSVTTDIVRDAHRSTLVVPPLEA